GRASSTTSSPSTANRTLSRSTPRRDAQVHASLLRVVRRLRPAARRGQAQAVRRRRSLVERERAASPRWRAGQGGDRWLRDRRPGRQAGGHRDREGLAGGRRRGTAYRRGALGEPGDRTWGDRRRGGRGLPR